MLRSVCFVLFYLVGLGIHSGFATALATEERSLSASMAAAKLSRTLEDGFYVSSLLRASDPLYCIQKQSLQVTKLLSASQVEEAQFLANAVIEFEKQNIAKAPAERKKLLEDMGENLLELSKRVESKKLNEDEVKMVTALKIELEGQVREKQAYFKSLDDRGTKGQQVESERAIEQDALSRKTVLLQSALSAARTEADDLFKVAARANEAERLGGVLKAEVSKKEIEVSTQKQTIESLKKELNQAKLEGAALQQKLFSVQSELSALKLQLDEAKFAAWKSSAKTNSPAKK